MQFENGFPPDDIYADEYVDHGDLSPDVLPDQFDLEQIGKEVLMLEFAKEYPTVSREILEAYLQTVKDKHKHDSLRLLIEYLCDPNFRRRLEDFIFSQTYRTTQL